LTEKRQHERVKRHLRNREENLRLKNKFYAECTTNKMKNIIKRVIKLYFYIIIKYSNFIMKKIQILPRVFRESTQAVNPV